jgi:hypothetical protein
MSKLEDIPKRDIFKVPDGYFESLPSIIQARVAKKERAWAPLLHTSLKYALPILAIAVGIFWFMPATKVTNDTEQLLAAIHPTDLIEYIQESEMNTEELLENIDFEAVNADSLYLFDSAMPLSEIDLEQIASDIETGL